MQKTSREIKNTRAKELELVDADNFLIKMLLFVEISAGSSHPRELIREIVVKKGFHRVYSAVIGFELTTFRCADFCLLLLPKISTQLCSGKWNWWRIAVLHKCHRHCPHFFSTRESGEINERKRIKNHFRNRERQSQLAEHPSQLDKFNHLALNKLKSRIKSGKRFE